MKLGILAEDPYIRSDENRAFMERFYEVVDYSGWREWPEAQLLERIRAVDVVVTGRHSPRLPAALVADRGRLKYLLHLHGTVRHLVTKAHIEAGLVVTNWGNEVWHVAEGALALVLTMLKQIPNLDLVTKGGPDRRIELAYPATLRGRDVGIYGLGPIGLHMAGLLVAFGSSIAFYDPYAGETDASFRRCETLEDLFDSCQIITIHCGLNDQTRGSVTRDLLGRLPQGGIVVNTARGGIVDESALADFVREGRLLAGVDVIQDESDWPGSPLAPLAGAVMTRHKVSGGWRKRADSDERRLPGHAQRNLRAFSRGRELQYVISADVYDLKT